MIRQYDSIAAIRDIYLRATTRSPDGDLSWYGNETREDVLRYSAEGNFSLVPEAEALLAELNTDISVPRREWERAPAGAFCAVPDVLAGLPTPMRRMRHTLNDVAPITILATTTSSASITATQLRRRGTTILALVMALTRIRPVTLYQLTVVDGNRDKSGETVITARINTAPLDLATACYVLTSAGFARRITYDVARTINDFTGGWPRGYRLGSSGKYFTALVPRLGLLPENTLIIPSAEQGDSLLRNPVEWVNMQVARFVAQTEDTAA